MIEIPYQEMVVALHAKFKPGTSVQEHHPFVVWLPKYVEMDYPTLVKIVMMETPSMAMDAVQFVR